MGRTIRKPTKKEKKEVLPKQYNQKAYNRMFRFGVFGFIALSGATIATNLMRNVVPAKEVTVVKKVGDTTKVDYRLQNWSNNFIYYYFNMSEDDREREKQLSKVKSFYAESFQLKNQSYNIVPMTLISYKLMSVEKDRITYLVSYRVTKTDETGNKIEESNVTDFTIPYAEEKGQYYVSDLPYFTKAKDSQLEKVPDKKRKTLDVTDTSLSEEKIKVYDEFLNLFFSNYVSSQENLDLIAEDVLVVDQTKFLSLDYSDYQSKNEGIIARAQVTFETTGASRSENFTFLIEEKGEKLKIKQMLHGFVEIKGEK